MRSARILTAALVCAVVPVGCGGGGDPQPELCPIGDVAAPAELEIIHLDALNTIIQTQANASVPLLPPPQGGWILLLGVRARNLDGCQTNLTTALVDAVDSQILQIDRRPTQLEVGADGWGVSSLTTFGNLPVCPQLTATRDLHDLPYVITVAVEDAFGKKATGSLTVVPTCPSGASRCTCECARDYVVGSPCAATGP